MYHSRDYFHAKLGRTHKNVSVNLSIESAIKDMCVSKSIYVLATFL